MTLFVFSDFLNLFFQFVQGWRSQKDLEDSLFVFVLSSVNDSLCWATHAKQQEVVQE